MKNYIFILFLAFGFNSCSQDGYQDVNLIPDIVFTTTIDIGLPQYQNLIIPFQYVVLDQKEGYKHRGIIVYNTGKGDQAIDQYLAFDLACPHITLTSCASPMDYSNFPELKNSCTSDNIFYNFELGYSYTYSKEENEDGELIQTKVEGKSYDMQQYRVDTEGKNLLRISNF